MIAPYDTERSLERMQRAAGPVRLGELLPELLARIKNLENERLETSKPTDPRTLGVFYDLGEFSRDAQ